MREEKRCYIAIDLKSFYASVECVEMKLDPLNTNLVVADRARTDKTICLAVSPALKSYGVPGRPRLFEVEQKVREQNRIRRFKAPGGRFTGKSVYAKELNESYALELDYIVAPPRMALYIEYSIKIYQIYLKYIAPEDMHTYSIDEVFIDATEYLKTYEKTPEELAGMMIKDVYETTGITATAGIGTNLYLCKVAMDIVAKHTQPDENGVRMAVLDEMSYRRILWDHRPLTDFWRVGRGYARKLEAQGMYTMGDVAACSIGDPKDYYNEELLYKMFGVNAQLLIDHAWGWEPCTIEEVKGYRPESKSLGSGQVLQEPYSYEKARLVTWEMMDLLALDLVGKKMVTNQVVLTVGYDILNLKDERRAAAYHGEVHTDHYGRLVPQHAHGTENLRDYTSSSKLLTEAVTRLYDRIVDPSLLIRRITICVNHVENEKKKQKEFVQMNLFQDYQLGNTESEEEKEHRDKEKKMQEAMLQIKRRYGKNAILKGCNLEEGATAMQRNAQIGGHRA